MCVCCVCSGSLFAIHLHVLVVSFFPPFYAVSSNILGIYFLVARVCLYALMMYKTGLFAISKKKTNFFFISFS